MTWDPDKAKAPQPPLDRGTKLRFWLRAIPFGIICFGSLGLLLILRQPERWIYGLHRPYRPISPSSSAACSSASPGCA